MKIPLSRALVFIFLSVIVISGPAFLGLLYYQSLLKSRSEDSRYLVRTILPSNSTLPADYLSELLELPFNLYKFKRQELERKLLASPLIREARVKKILPNKLGIHYKARNPLALLGDYENMAVDKDGYLFPCRPFFNPQELPVIYLGDVTNNPIQNASFHTAKKLLKILSKWHICHIDLTKVNERSLGKREIVVLLENEIYLRLTPENYAEELANFQLLQKNRTLKNAVVDLRLADLAFLKMPND